MAWPAANQASHAVAGMREVPGDMPADKSGSSRHKHGPAVRLRVKRIARVVAHRGEVRGNVGSGCQR